MNAYVGRLEDLTLENTYFRQVLFTGTHAQLVVMCLQPGEEIGDEVHGDVDQFFRIERGEARFVFNEKEERTARDGDAVVVPKGTYHNVINASKSAPLKLYTVYSPPNHPEGTIHKTKAEAEAAERSHGMHAEEASVLLTVSAEMTVSDAAAALHAAVEAHHFGVMHVHNLKETMLKKGVAFAAECLIFEVCQPQQAKTILDRNMGVSTALPCRISIFVKDGKTVLASLKPTALLAMFNEPGLEGEAREVEDTIVKIMKEAAAGRPVRL